MVIDFSKIDLKEQPVLVLQNLDGTAIQTLGYANSLKGELLFNEMSSITFNIPAMIEGVKTPRYDDIVGMRMIEMVGWGRFILVNPKIEKDGISEIKQCKAYSLEYEWTFKKMTLEEGTYNFWNPVAQEETILGIMLSYLPSWSVGSVDEGLIGRYRTFSVENENIYNFAKSTVQKSYGCVFDFDTMTRQVNVRLATSPVETNPVYLSLENLAKSISIEEDTENIFTVLDVNGADGVNIRSVNPMGTNKIYNLDYYMNETNFPREQSDMIDRWEEWKQTYKANQLVYYNTTIEKMLKTAELITAEYELSELKNVDLATAELAQSTAIETGRGLSDSNGSIASIKAKIKNMESEITRLNAEKQALTDELVKINDETSFRNFFSEDQLIVLDRYFKEDSVEDSSFVASSVDAYVDSDLSNEVQNVSCVLSASEFGSVPVTGKTTYTIRGGTIEGNILSGTSFSASVVSGCVERKDSSSEEDSGKFVLTAYLGRGNAGDRAFPKGCLSISGTSSALSMKNGKLELDIIEARVYLTQNTTEYERFSVEWDLFQYGEDCLRKLSYPSYSFDVSSANFLAADDFREFASKLSLGQKAYLDIGGDRPIEPILVGVSIDFEDKTAFNLSFGDTFNLSDSTFSLVDLLEKSISMGKTIDTGRFNYNSFLNSGASTAVKSFMDNALDVSKNAILAASGMDISWGSSGIRCRKKDEDGEYSKEQIAIINNLIAMTDNGWDSAKVAIGKVFDDSYDTMVKGLTEEEIEKAGLKYDASRERYYRYGIAAPYIFGTLLAGNNLIIESKAKDKDGNDVVAFHVDGDGAKLYNASFDIVKTDENGVERHIALNPDVGFAIGNYPVYDDENGFDADNAKFYVDANGNIRMTGYLSMHTDGKGSYDEKTPVINVNNEFKVFGDGSISANNGTFGGTLSGGTIDGSNIKGFNSLDSSGSIGAGSGTIGGDGWITGCGIKVGYNNGDYNFKVDQLGNVTIKGLSSSISWGAIDKSASIDKDISDAKTAADTAKSTADNIVTQWGYKGSTTSIDGTKIETGTIKAGKLQGGVVELLGADGETPYGGLYIGGAQTGDYAIDLQSNAALRLLANNGNLHLGTSNTTMTFAYDGEIAITAHFAPSTTSFYELGRSNRLWKNIYAATAPATQSDRNAKNSISYNFDSFEPFFDSLRPASFKMNDGTSGRTHVGFISQDVEESLYANGLDSLDFAGFIKSPIEDDDGNITSYNYALRYSEFIALCVHEIQRLKQRVKTLESQTE